MTSDTKPIQEKQAARGQRCPFCGSFLKRDDEPEVDANLAYCLNNCPATVEEGERVAAHAVVISQARMGQIDKMLADADKRLDEKGQA